MARRLGMNPKKLPRLRPSPEQRWKLPVGAFIEERYQRRFGDSDGVALPAPVPRSGTHSPTDGERDASEHPGDANRQLSDLVCYLMNLTDDLEQWLAHGTVDREVPLLVAGELREVAQALAAGAPIAPMPEIALPPRLRRGARSRRDDLGQASDDDIPF